MCPNLTTLQTIEKYLSVISDILKPKPSISEYLVSVARPNTGVAVANLLPLTSVILKKKRLVSKTRELLTQEAENDAPVRVLYERVVEMVFVLRGDLRHDRTRLCLSYQPKTVINRSQLRRYANRVWTRY